MIKSGRLFFDITSAPPIETLWAKLPSYYVGEKFVRLIPFKDHINIEAAAKTSAFYSISPSSA